MTEAVRKTRTPVSGHRNVLTVKDRDPSFVYRWVNDIDERIEMYKDGGWEPVTEKLQVGDKRVGTATTQGSAISKPVGNGIKAVLMRIKKEWYEEDQEAKLSRVRQIEADLNRHPETLGLNRRADHSI